MQKTKQQTLTPPAARALGPEALARKLQVEKQVRAHRHGWYQTNIVLDRQSPEHAVLKGLNIRTGVMRPEIMTSLFLARWLYANQPLYAGKRTLDMGCGCGIQGIVMGLHGAAYVEFSDISPEAIANTKENISQYGLPGKAKAVISDLFERLAEKFDVIVFNHPFFEGVEKPSDGVAGTMVPQAGLIHRFLEEAKGHLSAGGGIIMPYYHLAGAENDPALQGPKHGYAVSRVFGMDVEEESIQLGQISIYALRLK